MGQQRDGDIIVHQDLVEEVFDDRLAMLLLAGFDGLNVPIDDLVPITGGEPPTEAEYNLLVSAVNEILVALRNSRLIPEE